MMLAQNLSKTESLIKGNVEKKQLKGGMGAIDKELLKKILGGS